MFMTLHPWPPLALHPQHDCWDPDASLASSLSAFSFLWSFASMCSMLVRSLPTKRNHVNIRVSSVNDCRHDKLFKSSSSCFFDTLSVSSRKLCAKLIVILALVDHFRKAGPCLLLDSSRRASTRFSDTALPLHPTQCVRAKSFCFLLSVRTMKNRMLAI